MLTRTLAALTFLLVLAGSASARQTTPSQQPAETPAAKAPSPPMARHNVKLEVRILDQPEGAEPVRRNITMILADRRPGRVRTGGNALVGGSRIDVALNVDATASILDDNRINVDLVLDYAPRPAGTSATNGSHPARLSQRLTTLIVPGKPMVMSEASDPITERLITVEVTATILK